MRRTVLLVIILTIAAGLAGCGFARPLAPPTVTVTAPASPASASPVSSSGSTIQLVVVSSEKTIGSISYGDVGTFNQSSGQAAPWTMSYQLNPGYSVPSVTASLQGAGDESWVACQIRRDGVPIAQQWGKGSYALASCSVRAQ